MASIQPQQFSWAQQQQPTKALKIANTQTRQPPQVESVHFTHTHTHLEVQVHSMTAQLLQACLLSAHASSFINCLSKVDTVFTLDLY